MMAAMTAAMTATEEFEEPATPRTPAVNLAINDEGATAAQNRGLQPEQPALVEEIAVAEEGRRVAEYGRRVADGLLNAGEQLMFAFSARTVNGLALTAQSCRLVFY